MRHGAVRPNVDEKKTRGVRARHGLRAPCQRIIVEFEAGWGTLERVPRERFAHTPIWLKYPGDIPPFDQFP